MNIRHFGEALKTLGAIVLFLVILFAFMYAKEANAQISAPSVISWTLPTTGCSVGVTPCDNVVISATGPAALTSIEVFLSTSPIPDTFSGAPTLTLTGTPTTINHTMNVANGGTIYARVKAVIGTERSAMSAQASRVVTAPVRPGVPTNVTITVNITPAPAANPSP